MLPYLVHGYTHTKTNMFCVLGIAVYRRNGRRRRHWPAVTRYLCERPEWEVRSEEGWGCGLSLLGSWERMGSLMPASSLDTMDSDTEGEEVVLLVLPTSSLVRWRWRSSVLSPASTRTRVSSSPEPQASWARSDWCQPLIPWWWSPPGTGREVTEEHSGEETLPADPAKERGGHEGKAQAAPRGSNFSKVRSPRFSFVLQNGNIEISGCTIAMEMSGPELNVSRVTSLCLALVSPWRRRGRHYALT